VTSLQMRSSVISSVYRKALKLSNQARRQFTVGEITNLMSIDAQRIVETFPYLNQVWTAPFTIVLCMIFLYIELGVSSLAGLATLLFIIPVNLWAGRVALRLQKDQLEKKDARLKLMNEILAGVKVLKLYAWEYPFMKRIESIRDKEVRNLKTNAQVLALSNCSFALGPTMVTLATFGVYIALNPDEVLTAERIFVCLTLFNIIRLPLTMFPWAVIEAVKLFVSFNRISQFLNAEELSENIGEDLDSERNAVEIENATFVWERNGEENGAVVVDEEKVDNGQKGVFALRDISLTVPKGSLVAVVGAVGSGKSSLISAVLGEMERRSGRAGRQGRVAYVPQQAWIQNMVRNRCWPPCNDPKFPVVAR